MKKHLKKVHMTLQQEVTLWHWLAILLLPCGIYIVAYIYAQALKTSVPEGVPVHTRIVYYDGNFSQDIAIEELETAVYVINQSNDVVNVTAYEYLQSSNQNAVSKVQIAPKSKTVIATVKPSLVLIESGSKSSSLILIGKNNLGDEERAQIIKNKLASLTTNPENIPFAVLQLSKIRKYDASTNSICSSVYDSLTSTAQNTQQQILSKEETCGSVKEDATNIINTNNLKNSKSTTSLQSFIKDTFSNPKPKSMVEFTLPDNY
jgi:hypothetical protein